MTIPKRGGAILVAAAAVWMGAVSCQGVPEVHAQTAAKTAAASTPAAPTKQAAPATPVAPATAGTPAQNCDTVPPIEAKEGAAMKPRKIQRTEEEWKRILTPEQYQILRKKGTERAFTGKYAEHHEDGTYRCAACGEPLFVSTTKYDSGSGWPSFYQPVNAEAVEMEKDDSLFMVRTEVLCRACGSHLGHVFDDGPQPTGMRYCINSASLKFEGRK